MAIKNAMVCSYDTPCPERDSGSRRVFHFIEFLIEAGWTVTFLASNGARNPREKAVLEQLGVAVYDSSNTLLEKLLAATEFQLAVVAFWLNAERYMSIIRKVSPSTRVIVDSVDLHFLRDSRRIFCQPALSGGMNLLTHKYASHLIGEINMYAASDLVLTVSEKEAGIINDFVADPDLAVPVPDCEDLQRSDVPFEKRKGILFVGSFEHPPNIQAVGYLCKEILPRLDPAVLAEHPVYIVGNRPTETVLDYARPFPSVRVLGWVPSILPYFERARVSVVPLLYGAGTKRKLIQALLTGTPTVSTLCGVEGLGLRDKEHVLIADAPDAFASSLTLLLTNEPLWQKLARAGRQQIVGNHNRKTTKARLNAAIARALSKTPKPMVSPQVPDEQYPGRLTFHAYQQLLLQIRDQVETWVPPYASIAVVSKGDAELLKLGSRRAFHFPQAEDGGYAGFHPRDSGEAIAYLDSLRSKKVDYLLFPETALWWLDHYQEFGQHLRSTSRAVHRGESCVIFCLNEKPIADDSPLLAALPGGENHSRLSLPADPANPAGLRFIAFYLPQFHPIPENDEWWGEGFTEWRNVAKACPLFEDHYQPHLPADLGFYDLRSPETRSEQASLARAYGIHGFCYYHYWFSGKRLLERPFNEVLESGEPDFPFCLCWANDPWSRKWNGEVQDLLQAQTYSPKDDIAHIQSLLPALRDRRAIKIEGKPVFLVWRGKDLPNPSLTIKSWRREVERAGLEGIYLIAVETAWDLGWDATAVGFDAKVLFQPQFSMLIDRAFNNGAGIPVPGRANLQVYDCEKAWPIISSPEPVNYRRYETVIPSWDNTSRVGDKAVIMHKSSPALYEKWLKHAAANAKNNPRDHRIVFINAWNEWAEGCHLEPDLRNGRGYLEATRRALESAGTIPTPPRNAARGRMMANA